MNKQVLKTLGTALLMFACGLGGFAQDTAISGNIPKTQTARIDIGVVGLPSVAFGGEAALAYSGTGMVVGLDLPIVSVLHFSAGLSAELNTMGSVVLLPLGLGTVFPIGENLEFDLRAQGIVGAALYRPTPLAAVGFQGSAGLAWYLDGLSGFEFRLGARYIVVPEYEEKYGDYSFFDLPLEIALVFKL